MPVAFVTDSTAYIPAGLVQEYAITVAPQTLIWGEETFRDGVDIQPDEFYARLRTAKTMPSTAQVSIVTMQDIFAGLVDKGFDVIGVFIAAKLSGTMLSAMQAREALGTAASKVTVVDSGTTAMAMGFEVLAAARAAAQGATVADCTALIQKAREHVGVYFAVDTLEFLHRGGRIGGAQRFIGSALNLKPILALRDAHVDAIERVHTKSKALDRLVELVTADVKGKPNVHLATLHADAEKEAVQLLERAGKELKAVETVISSVSPVVGVHAGPGTVGIAYMAGM